MKGKGDLVIFLGAGISKPLGIPDMYEFVSEFKNKIKNNAGKSEILENIINTNKECYQCGYIYTGKKNPPEHCRRCGLELNKIDLEELMSRLYYFSEIPNNAVFLKILKPDDREIKLLSEISELKEELMDFIYERCEVFDRGKAKKIIGKLTAFREYLGYDGLKIFTTNYDTCVETVYENEGFATGFEQRGTLLVWNPINLSETKRSIKLYKLHGSITWYKYEGDLIQMPALGRKLDHKKTKFESHILYPLTGKEMFQSPFSELQNHLQKALESCELFIVIGYSFRDESIKRIFINATHENPDLKGIIIDPRIDQISLDFRNKLKLIDIYKSIEEINFTEKEFLRELKEDDSNQLQSKTYRLKELGEHEGAIVIGKESIKRALEKDNFHDAAYAAAFISDCYDYIENEKMGTQYRNKSIEYYEKFDKGNDPSAYHNLGVMYGEKKNHPKALKNFRTSLGLYEKRGDLKDIKRLEDLVERMKRKISRKRKKPVKKKK